MSTTDYSKIAGVYDDNPVRLRIAPDAELAAIVARAAGRTVRVLDVACGTGNWIVTQRTALEGHKVSFHGIDASLAMLARARTKRADVQWIAGRAEALPYRSQSFDHVSLNFAFHHLEDKQRALQEMARVLQSDGRLRIENVVPEASPRWWGYAYFPATIALDERRFWRAAGLTDALEHAGFEVVYRMNYERRRIPLTEAIAEAERRDVSQLATISDADYARGMATMRAEIAREPALRIENEIALAVWSAVRRG